MNPIPAGSGITTTWLPIDGALALLVLATMATIAVIFVMMLWSLFTLSELDTQTIWRRHPGDVAGRSATSDGTRIDLIRPSPVGRRSIDGGKTPLRRTTAA